MKNPKQDRLRKTSGGRRHLQTVIGAQRTHPKHRVLPRAAAPDTPKSRSILVSSFIKADIIKTLRRIRRRFREVFGYEI
jgi:hypothetical protein